MNKKYYYAFGCLALALFIILSILVKLHYTQEPISIIDSTLQTAAWHLQDNTFLVQISAILAKILGNTIGSALLLVLIAFMFMKDKVSATWLALISGIAVGGNVLIKLLVGRQRPETHRLADFAEQTGKSFASGHTTFAVVLFGGLFFILIQQLNSTLNKSLIALLALALILLVMFSRILIGVHYPSDTLGGLLWGSSVISLTYPTYLKFKQRSIR